MKSKVKEAIVRATTELINEYDGDISKVTARAIAEKANVSLGLINYHFGNKDNLILVCTQKIILGVVTSFKPAAGSNIQTMQEKLCVVGKQVFDFLYKNEAISQVAILGDMESPSSNNNTLMTMRGFASILGEKYSGAEKNFKAFKMISAMQEAFLYRDIMAKTLGYDFEKKEERDRYIEDLVASITK